ncbi:hypothetical protein ILYODFUR_007819 [Ilyodon furcidens]|uniref:Uncharacterized protein n=1 Tax=Ilyodon furcidens TaxID=33524 RepID=A0ABV0THX8_9TELE
MGWKDRTVGTAHLQPIRGWFRLAPPTYQGLQPHISLIRDKSTQRADTTRYNPLELMSLEETHWDCFKFSLWINLNLLMKF